MSETERCSYVWFSGGPVWRNACTELEGHALPHDASADTHRIDVEADHSLAALAEKLAGALEAKLTPCSHARGCEARPVLQFESPGGDIYVYCEEHASDLHETRRNYLVPWDEEDSDYTLLTEYHAHKKGGGA